MSVSQLIKNGLHRLRHIRWLRIKEDTNKIRFLEKSLMQFLKILRLVDYLDVNHHLKKVLQLPNYSTRNYRRSPYSVVDKATRILAERSVVGIQVNARNFIF